MDKKLAKKIERNIKFNLFIRRLRYLFMTKKGKLKEDILYSLVEYQSYPFLTDIDVSISRNKTLTERFYDVQVFLTFKLPNKEPNVRYVKTSTHDLKLDKPLKDSIIGLVSSTINRFKLFEESKIYNENNNS